MASLTTVARPIWSDDRPAPSDRGAAVRNGAAAAEFWDDADSLDIGLAQLDQHGRLIGWNDVFADAFELAENAGALGLTLQQMLVLATADGGTIVPAGNGAAAWAEAVLNAAATDGVAAWTAADGARWQLRFSPLSHGRRWCRLLALSSVGLSSAELSASEMPGAERAGAEPGGAVAPEPAAGNPLAESLAKMGHELRTPLNAIIGFSDLLRMEALGPLNNASYLEYATDINDSGQALLTMVDRISLLAKLDGRLVTPQVGEIGIRALVEMAIETVAPQASPRDVSVVEIPADDDDPDSGALLQVDRYLFAAALEHLLDNAVRASADGGLVTIGWHRGEEGEFCIDVCDHGPGIPEDRLEAVLVPFVRLENMAVATPANAGLGLPLAVKLAGLFDGWVKLSSAEGGGTCASLVLPAERVRLP